MGYSHIQRCRVIKVPFRAKLCSYSSVCTNLKIWFCPHILVSSFVTFYFNYEIPILNLVVIHNLLLKCIPWSSRAGTSPSALLKPNNAEWTETLQGHCRSVETDSSIETQPLKRIIFSVNSHVAIQNLNINQPRHLRLSYEKLSHLKRLWVKLLLAWGR